jgi:hypothetical protein
MRQVRLSLEPVLNDLDRLLHSFLIQPEFGSDTFHYLLSRRWKHHVGRRADENKFHYFLLTLSTTFMHSSTLQQNENGVA